MEDVVHFSPGTGFNFALRADGSLWGWANNSGRRYGPGLPTTHPAPVFIMDGVAYAKISGDVIFGHTSNFFVVTADGRLLAWGQNHRGQLGDGTTVQRFSPVHIMDNIVSVAAGRNNTFALDTSGRLWGWGRNTVEGGGTGIIGDGSGQHQYTPVHIMDDVVSVESGRGIRGPGDFTMALRTDGSLWTWGVLLGEPAYEPVHVMDGVLLP